MKIAVYGLGKLGLPLASVLTRDGHEVRGWDSDPDRIEWCVDQQRIERAHGMNPIDEPGVYVSDIVFGRDPDPATLNFIVVPTPSLENGEFDSYAVEEAIRTIAEINDRHSYAVITSTVFPGTSERLHNLYGDKVTVVYNPTFIALGSVVENLTRPNILLFGVNEEDDVSLVEDVWRNCTEGLYHTHIGSYVEAELLKLSINCALATKISLANQLGHLFSAYAIDPVIVSELGADPRIGPAFMMPGSPISGPCLPRDNKALQLAAARVHQRLPLSEATEDVDFELRLRLYNNITDEIVEQAKKNQAGSVGLLGITYKYGVPLTEGSVGAWLERRLGEDGYEVNVYDDHWAGSDDLAKVLASDVIVVTHRELDRLSENAKGAIIRVWP
jgi:UDPglucose 6-dehydrogenase